MLEISEYTDAIETPGLSEVKGVRLKLKCQVERASLSVRYQPIMSKNPIVLKTQGYRSLPVE
jgi:hypothetical protein